MTQPDERWPVLPWADWRETALTLQLWTQIVGKVRLSLTPWLNHSWQVPLYISARGLATSPIPAGGELLEIEFDFIDQRVALPNSRGMQRDMPLAPQPVAGFYRRLLALLGELKIET